MLHLAKAPTDVERAFQSIEQALRQLAPELGLTVGELLERTDVFTYGTTRATNAIVEGRTARTAFFTTEGFPDILLLREGGKLEPFRQLPYPPPYVPRYLTFEIRERIDSEGDVFRELDEQSVLDSIAEARRLGAEAVGVCLIWSIVNPAHELRVGELLARTDVFTYGTTRATNAIVEGRTARTAFFTTEGFPDVLLLREGGKPDPFRQLDYPPPYVPRHLTFEIRERIDSEGDVFVPLDEGSVLRAIESARALGAEAVAVCLVWSIVNGTHELRIGELLAEEWPGVPFTLSHRLNPIIREYRRASSAAIDASLKPLMQAYLRTLERDLRAAGLRGHIFVATSFGGAWRPQEVAPRTSGCSRRGGVRV